MRIASVFRYPALLTLSLLWVSPNAVAQSTQQEQPPPASPPPTPTADGDSLPPAVMVNAAEHPNLQAAVDALPPAGGIVFVPPGIHDLEKPLVIRSGDTRLQGSGTATQLRNVNRDGEPAVLIRPDGMESNRRARLWRVEVCDLRVSGNRESGIGIQAIGVQEIVFRNLSVDRHGSHGIAMKDCLENPRVIGCNLTYNNGSGIHIDGGHDVIVSASQFEENVDALTMIDGFNLTFTGNNLDDHLRHGLVVENTYGSVISGNMFEECQGTAIILDRDCYGTAISSNAIAHHLGGGIDLKDAWGCTITGNNFVIVHEFSIRVGKDSGRHTITGNQFTNSYIGDGKIKRTDGLHGDNRWRLDAGAGIVLEQTEDILISANHFSGLTGHAVQARGECQRLVVSNNLVVNHGRLLPPDTPTFDLGEAADSVTEPNLVGPQTPEPAK